MGTNDEVLQRMHHRISQESSEKEASKMDVAQLRRVVELHIRQLSSLANSSWSKENFNRLKSALRTFDAEARVGCDVFCRELSLSSGGL